MKRRVTIVVLMVLFALYGLAQAGLNEDLFAAVKKGNLQEVQRLVSAGADVKVKDNVGNTPLHWTAGLGMGYADVAKFLLSKGATVNAKNDADRTPLHFAAEWGHTAVARLLLSKGAEVNAKDNDGKTPLQVAEGQGEKELAKLLRQHGGR